MMLVALLEIARCWKDSLILCKPLSAGVCRGDELLCCVAGTEDCLTEEVGGGGLLGVSVEGCVVQSGTRRSPVDWSCSIFCRQLAMTLKGGKA